MSKILICHPDVFGDIHRQIIRKFPAELVDSIGAIEVRFNSCMDTYRKTGRYILPDGSCVLPEDVVVSDRFTEYGYDDIWYLLWAGIIREEMTAVLYLMDDVSDFDLYNPKLFNPLEPW